MASILQNGLIVSCQAEEGSPFNAPEFIVAFAQAAELGGAVAVRIRDVQNVRAVREVVQIPIVGIAKGLYESGEVLITPNSADVEALIDAGADIVAVDATTRVRPSGQSGIELLKDVLKHFQIPVIADVATLEEGIGAAAAGADFVGTTLSGYTSYTEKKNNDLPDLELIRQLTRTITGKVIAEGRFWTPEQAAEAIRLGAHAVVVGTAITRPVEIVRRFVQALR